MRINSNARRHALPALGWIAWGLIVTAGFASLTVYSAGEGEAGVSPQRLDGPLARGESAPEAILFAHPRCPCTRASLVELIDVLHDCDARGTVVFWQPEDAGADWRESPTIELAESCPRLRVVWDLGGKLTTAYGAITSGHCLAYDAGGELRFTGGLTPGRGHEGPTTSQQRLQSLLTGAAPAGDGVVAFPVYGCRIAPAAS